MPYVTRDAVRAMKNMGNTNKLTDAEIDAAIDWFEVKFERYTGVAWIPRTVLDERHYATNAGTVTLNHMFPRSITAVRAYSTATASTPYTAAELADLRLDDSGVIRRVSLGSFASGYGLIAFDYTHSATTAPPADVVEAAKVAIRDRLLGDNSGNRAYSISTEAGIVRSSTPGPKTPFGLQDVDEVANAYMGGPPPAIPAIA